MLKMSENLAGVTLLAFGNGSPDIFASLANSSEDTELMYAELIGAAVFVTGFIAGIVILVRPFKLNKRNHIRDVLFFLTGILIINGFMQDGIYKMWEGVATVAIYVAYLMFVIIEHIRMKRKVGKVRSSMQESVEQGRSPSLDVIKSIDDIEKFSEIMIYSRRSSSVILDREFDKVFQPVLNRGANKDFFKSFAHAINPIDMHDWTSSGWIGKIFMVLKVRKKFFLMIFFKLHNIFSRPPLFLCCILSFQSWITVKSFTVGANS